MRLARKARPVAVDRTPNTAASGLLLSINLGSILDSGCTKSLSALALRMKLSELRSLTERLVLSDVLIISEVFVNCSELIEDICEFDEALVEALIDADVLADSLALVEALIDADVLADSLALVDALCDAEVLADSEALVEALIDADVLAD